MLKEFWQERKNYLIGGFILILLLTALIVYYRVRNKKESIGTTASDYMSGTNKNNHNVGNIRTSNIFWQGEMPNLPGDENNDAFEVFKSDEYGFRAMFKLLTNYVVGGYTTLRAIITHYAPPTDNNDTESYIAAVAAQAGIMDNDLLSVTLLKANTGQLFKGIVKAMAKRERGKTYADSVINNGYQLYLS